MGIRLYSLLWVMQDFYHQPYHLGHVVGLHRGNFGQGGATEATGTNQHCFGAML